MLTKPTIKLIIKAAEIIASITIAAIEIITGRKKNDSTGSSKEK